jgi:predicted secreted hydrolase
VLDDQELRTERSRVTYWEGAVAIEGTRRGVPVRGRGYLEMTSGTDDDKRLSPKKMILK